MKTDNRKYIFWFCLAVVINIALRFVIMYITDHFDFKNFLITGEIVASGKNIYANTIYYNYGPLFSIILGFFYRIASCFGGSVILYKALIVLFLTAADLLLALLASRTAGKLWGILFFLNPISVYIAGYQTQFDNVAVMFGAWAVYFVRESSENESFTFNDMCGTILLSFSLIMKHFMWAFPLFLLLNTRINTRKKIFYAFLPPLIFLLSFLPYLPEGLDGIIHNVLMYRSANNFPLFAIGLLKSFRINFPFLARFGIVIYGIFMLSCAYAFRHENIYNSFLIYTMSAVCFASGIYSQQFVIPCMAVILIFQKWSLSYFAVYLARLGGSELRNTLCIWCLLAYLVYYYRRKDQRVL